MKTLSINVPFKTGDKVFLLKETKRGDNLSFSFEAHTCEKIVVSYEEELGQEPATTVKVKLDNLKNYQSADDCFTSLEELSAETNRRSSAQSVVTTEPAVAEEVTTEETGDQEVTETSDEF